MRKSKKKYKRPKMIWNKARIERDKELKKAFGLVRAREIWNAETLLRKYRRLARRLAATKDKKMESDLTGKLSKLGILGKGAGLDDVLSMSVENILERRLQTVVFKQGHAHTPKEARQMIVHGHVKIGNRRASYPSYLVPKIEEDKIKVTRPKTKSVKTAPVVKEKEVPASEPADTAKAKPEAVKK